MNKQFSFHIAILLVIFLSGGCKKSTSQDNHATPNKDYSDSLINKTWWGTFAYKNQGDQYYSMHFNADKTLDWDQLLGFFKGFWTLDSNRLIITFEGNDTKITAIIGDDNKLRNISDN